MEFFILSDSERLDGKTGNPIDRDKLEKKKEISLRGLRNSFVSFQLVFKNLPAAPETLQIDITFQELLQETQKPEFHVYYEWFHQWDGKLIPDMLMPMNMAGRCEVSALKKQYYTSDYDIYWVDCFLPVQHPAGTFQGVAVISCEGVKQEIPIEIVVSSGVLCNEALLHADCNNYADSVSRNTPRLRENSNRYADGSCFEEERKYFRLTHAHRAFFHYLTYTHAGYNYLSFAPKLEGAGRNIKVSDWSVYDAHFGPYFDGSAFEGTERGALPLPFAYLPFCLNWPSSYEKWGTEGFKIENRRILQDFIRHFEEKGWTETVFELFLNHKKRYRYYPCDGDETRHSHDDEMAKVQDEIFTDLLNQSDVQVVLRTDSSWSFGKHYNSDMNRIFKLWVASGFLSQFHADSYKVMREKGNILFEYTGLPTLEQPLLKLFQWPVRCLMNGADGIVYWNTTGFGEDYLTCPVNGGSEAFMYPSHLFGLDDGPVASLRLKFHRNTMQCIDFVKMQEGTNLFSDMKQAVNRVLCTDDTQWVSPLPPEMEIDPAEMTNESIANAPYHDPIKNTPLDAPGHLFEELMNLYEQGAEKIAVEP